MRKVSPRAAFAEWTLDSRPQALPPRRLDHVARMSDDRIDLGHCVLDLALHELRRGDEQIRQV